MRRLLATTILAATLPGLAAAQDRPSLLDYFSIDVIAQRLLQSGIMLLRTQVDLKYSDMSVDIRTGGITITDLKAWPLPEWDEEGECEIAADRILLRSGALDEPERMRFKAQLINTSFPPACLPGDVREGLDMAGLEDVFIPRLTVDIDYGIPGADGSVRLYADVADAAIVDVNAEFAYFWFDGRDDMEEPLPVVFLESATVALENQGIWDAMKGQLPPPFTGEGSGLMLEGMLGESLIGMNRDAGDDSGALLDSQRTFIASLGQTWSAFVANPEMLVLETNIDGDAYIDFEFMEDDIREVFDVLQPTLSVAPRRASAALPIDLLQQALGDGASSLTEAERKTVGIALVTGVGAPRNADAGFGLLNPIARAGDGEAAAVMADALKDRAPEDAYRWALIAGRTGREGSTALLDRIERKLPFQRVLELQDDVSGSDVLASANLEKLSRVRDAAAKRLSGRGEARSYEIAALWAMIASAAGDPEAADILEQIEERVRLAGDTAQGPWAIAESRASGKAMDAWISGNLAALYAQ